MFHFGNSDPNAQLTFCARVFNDFQAYRTPNSLENQRALQNLKMQSEYLISQVSSLKQVIKNLASEIRQNLKQMSQQLSTIKKEAEEERPKKKFKKVIACPKEDCGRKYSSLIALNCHIKNKHSFRGE